MTKRSSSPMLAPPPVAIRGGGVRARIYDALLAAVRDGTLAAGSRLPSSRQLAADWGIARNTIDDALSQLQAEGVVVRLVGRGSFVASGVVARSGVGSGRHRRMTAVGRRALQAASSRGAAAARTFAAASIPRPDAFVAGMADADAFPLDAWRRVCARCWRAQGRALLGYLPASGWPPLQQAIADHVAVARGVRCEPQQVMVLNSSMQAIDLVARTLAERHDVAWVEDPCYPNLPAALAMAGLRIVPVPVDGDGLTFARVAPADAPALICVTPSCQYPTGTTLSLARRVALLQLAARSRAWILEDDHQHEFAGQRLPASLFALDRDARTLYLGTFSHTMFPSLRLAYVVLPQRLVDVFHAVRRQLDDHTHGFMQAALAEFIAGGQFAAHLRQMRPLYAARRDALVDAVARHRPPMAASVLANGMHAAVDLPARISDVAVAARAARAGVRVLPLSRYGLGSSRRNGLLLGFAALSERRIVAGVARLMRATPEAWSRSVSM